MCSIKGPRTSALFSTSRLHILSGLGHCTNSPRVPAFWRYSCRSHADTTGDRVSIFAMGAPQEKMDDKSWTFKVCGKWRVDQTYCGNTELPLSGLTCWYKRARLTQALRGVKTSPGWDRLGQGKGYVLISCMIHVVWYHNPTYSIIWIKDIEGIA